MWFVYNLFLLLLHENMINSLLTQLILYKKIATFINFQKY